MRPAMWLAAAGVFALTASPAVAEGELQLSRDGTTWTTDLSDPLFDSTVRWVPGDTRSSSFYVRNVTSQQGRLAVDILDTTTTELIDTGDVSVDAQGAGGAWTAVTEAGTHRLLSDGVVPGGETRRIDVTVSFAATSGNNSQVKTLPLHLRVQLVEHVESTGPDDGDSDDGGSDDHGGFLPDTGAPAWWIGLTSAALMLAGAMVRRQSRSEEARHG